MPQMSPTVARVIGAIGRTLIGLGIIILLFAVYQLWGTGLAHSQAQNRLESEFAARLERVTDPGPATNPAAETSTSSTTSPNEPLSPVVEPQEPSAEDLDPEVLAGLIPEPGDPLARIRIPAIGVDEIVVHGVSVADLRQGPGHYPDSPMPGQPGNSAIAGHRTTYGQPFHDLDRLQPDDEIIVQTLQGEFHYRVMGHPDDTAGEPDRGHFIVPDTGVEVLEDFGDDRLTLTACHPKFSSRQRIVVTAALVDPPAPAPPPPPPTASDPAPTAPEQPEPVADFGEGLSGDDAALAPTLVWGAAFLAVLIAAVVVGARWRRWPAYLVASPGLVICLYFTFLHLDQYLPSY